MVKQVVKSDKVQKLVAKVLGDDSVDLDTLAIFEAVFITTLPLKRLSGIYQGAHTGADVLAAAKTKLDAGETIPLALMHREGLPTGRVLSADLRPGPNGSTQLQGMFYLPKKDNSVIVSKLDSGVINEVSINFMPQNLLCSECAWDYMSDEATFENIFGCVCANDHKIGVSGAHVNVHGLKAWQELSLVGRGASQGALILPRSQHSSNTDAAARFAARGFDDRILELRASAADSGETTTPIVINSSEKTDMPDPSAVELQANLIVAGRDLAASQAALTASAAEVVSLKAQIAVHEATIAALTAADAGKMKVELDAATGLITEITTASLAQAGRGSETPPETISGQVTLIRDLRAKLAMIIPVGGAAASAAQGDAKTLKPNTAAFRRSK